MKSGVLPARGIFIWSKQEGRMVYLDELSVRILRYLAK